jgi:mRNA interferase RelE/StbE
VRYSLEIKKDVRKDVDRLPNRMMQRINRRFISIAENPYAGAQKLSGDPAFRVRVGDYRIVYDINDETKTVTILQAAHRREAYR